MNFKIPNNLKIEYIPPYSPELNSEERRFEDIKKFLKNKKFKSIEKKFEKVLFSYTKTKLNH